MSNKPLLDRLIADEACAVAVANGGMVFVTFPDGLSQKYELTAQRLEQWIKQCQPINISFTNECVGLMYNHYERYGR